jgi:hypothetical protein
MHTVQHSTVLLLGGCVNISAALMRGGQAHGAVPMPAGAESDLLEGRVPRPRGWAQNGRATSCPQFC